MRYLDNNYIKRAIFAAIALGVLSVGIVSMATMNHNSMAMSEDRPMAASSGDCSQPKDSGVCIDYHLGVIQSLANALPQGFGIELLGLILVGLLAAAVFGSLDVVYRFYCRLKIRLKQLMEETVSVFQIQLGFWLAIIQKKDPSYAFALV